MEQPDVQNTVEKVNREPCIFRFEDYSKESESETQKLNRVNYVPAAKVDPALNILVGIAQHLELVLVNQVLVGDENGQNTFVHAFPGQERERTRDAHEGQHVEVSEFGNFGVQVFFVTKFCTL